MSITAYLNGYIRSLARREVKPLIAKALKRGAEHRRTIAMLKKELKAIHTELAVIKRILPQPTITVAPDVLKKSRLRIDGMKRHRQTLGLSASDYGKLMGVSSLTVYNWENGKTKPRRSQLAGIVAVRGIGKREALKRLEK